MRAGFRWSVRPAPRTAAAYSMSFPALTCAPEQVVLQEEWRRSLRRLAGLNGCVVRGPCGLWIA
jgi:hypothetical protein